jgi:UDP-N-acetylmuramyl pentapeptide phosphotransferase/UDP-N-acetylglucosamine-1-phosphate transferase
VTIGTRGPAGRAGRLGVALAGAGAARALLAGLTARPPGGAEAWTRTNHRGAPVSLLAGPALAGAAAATVAAGASSARVGAAAAGAVLASAGVGWYDDVVGARPEQRADKGFAGHLRALAGGRVSAGVVKVAGVGGASLLAVRAAGLARGPVGTVVAAGVVAGTANLVNLLDLRPGRALKAGLLAGVPMLGGPHGGLAAGPVGAAAALLGDDLAEQTMLGDAGANALGAALGFRLAAGLGPRARLAVLAGLVALTAASEKVSFTRVIAATPGLRELDELGRRPAPQ